MSAPLVRVRFAALLFVAALSCCLAGDGARSSPHCFRFKTFPSQILWTWQRPEDLRGIDPAQTAIAYLDQTIRIGEYVLSVSRTQSLAYPEGTKLISVVRIETSRHARLDAAVADEAVRQTMLSVNGRVAALQVDFDAALSERDFYRSFLGKLRRRMPPDLPLSITALVSWCSYDDWVRDLPVDEAVPMFFRMGPDARRVRDLTIQEPLCSQSLGVSTREPWPVRMEGKRVYVFADRGWKRDFEMLESRVR